MDAGHAMNLEHLTRDRLYSVCDLKTAHEVIGPALAPALLHVVEEARAHGGMSGLHVAISRDTRPPVLVAQSYGGAWLIVG